MIVSGNAVSSERFNGTPLFDAFTDGDVLDAAIAFSKKILGEQTPLKRLRDITIDYANFEAFFQFARNSVRAVAGPFPAPLKAVEAVAASVSKPFDEAMALETSMFRVLIGTSESTALRHAFMAERAASKIPDVPDDTATRNIASIGVIGAGTMGGGISISFLNAGIQVTILETNQEALDKGVATIGKTYESLVKRGHLKGEDAKKRMALLKPTLAYDDLKEADLVIEAVFEDIGVKEIVFKKLDVVLKPGAILASNTSTLDVDLIAAFTQRPQDVVGTHFFSPANIMKLLEVVRGEKTGKDVLATVMKLAKKIKKTAVVSGVCDGFIGNRMVEEYFRQVLFLIEEGATPPQIDKALEKWGMAMGPFRMSDLAGNDIGWAIRKRRYVERPHLVYSKLADRLCELGRFGQKTGAGWYRYETGKRNAIPDPVVDQLVADYRREIGVNARVISDEEIVHRCVLALVNEGAHILGENIAARASDIDMVYLTGYGFPLHRGGPMHYANSLGLPNVLRKMQQFATNERADPVFWQPAKLLAELAAEGKTFN
jgi:3-hydroxyacyl-CoA dehydrogenase